MMTRRRTQPPPAFYVTDLDGTLLQNDGTLSAFARENLTRLLEAGTAFTVASARSSVSIRETLGELPLRLPVIEINGAFVTDYATMEHLVVNDIDKSVLEALYAEVLAAGCVCFVSTFNGTEDCLYHPEIVNEGIGFYYDNRYFCKDKRLRPLLGAETPFEDAVVALTVIERVDTLVPLARRIKERFGKALITHLFENIYSPGWWWLTIHDRRACKSIAIQEIAERRGLSLERLTVFGDSANDLGMFRMAPRAVAVENAISALRAEAGEIIGPNHQDAVVRYILADAGQ